MADKKITQFSGYTGWVAADTGVWLVVATGSPTNLDSTNYKYNFTGMASDVTKSIGGGKGPILGGDDDNVFIGPTDPDDIRNVRLVVGGETKILINKEGNVFIAEDFTVSGDSYLEQDLYIGKDLTVTGNSIFKSDATFEGDAYFQDDAFVKDDLTVSGDLHVTGDLYVSGTTHVNEIIDVSITGTISGVTGVFDMFSGKSGIFSERLSISGHTVLTGAKAGGGSPGGPDAGNVGGEGTAGYISKWDTSFDLTNSALYQDAQGEIGLGTTSPSGILHIRGTSPELTIESTGTNFAAHLYMINSTNMWQMESDDDISIGSHLRFSWTENNTDPAAKENDLLVLTTGDGVEGTVGIGTRTPLARLHVTGGDGRIIAPCGEFSECLTISGVAVSTGDVGGGGGGEPSFISDERLKENPLPIRDSAERLKYIRGVGFVWNDDAPDHLRGNPDVGVIAQEVERVLPEAVSEDKDGYLQVAYHKIIPLLVEGFNNQQVEIKNLKADIKKLKKRPK